MGAIGWRLRKHYFKVTPKPSSEAKSGGKLLTKSSSQTHSGGGGGGVSKSLTAQHLSSSSTATTTASCSSSASAGETSANTNINVHLAGGGGGSGSSSCSSSSTSSTTTLGATAPDFGRLLGSELILEWLEYGPDKYVEDKELTGILRSLTLLQHPFIEPILYAAHNECGCLTIRR